MATSTGRVPHALKTAHKALGKEGSSRASVGRRHTNEWRAGAQRWHPFGPIYAERTMAKAHSSELCERFQQAALHHASLRFFWVPIEARKGADDLAGWSWTAHRLESKVRKALEVGADEQIRPETDEGLLVGSRDALALLDSLAADAVKRLGASLPDGGAPEPIDRLLLRLLAFAGLRGESPVPTVAARVRRKRLISMRWASGDTQLEVVDDDARLIQFQNVRQYVQDHLQPASDAADVHWAEAVMRQHDRLNKEAMEHPELLEAIAANRLVDFPMRQIDDVFGCLADGLFGGGETASPPTAPECHVTLLQMASIVNRRKKTLERLKDNGKLPRPSVKGGRGKADEWAWSKVRTILEEEYGRQLPEVFPADRFIHR